MKSDTGSLVVKVIIVFFLVQLVLVGYVFYQSYAGRADVVKHARLGCERGKLDRNANSEGWRIAEKARRQEGQDAVANRYARIARGQERRSRIDCREAYPKAGVFP